MSTTVAAHTNSERKSRSNGQLRVVGGDQRIDLVAAEQAARDLLLALGRNPDSEHLADTPRRVAGALAELLTPQPFDLTTFANDEG